MKETILCINSRQDKRQKYLAEMLMKDGYSVVLCETFCPDIKEYDIVLLPVLLKDLDLKKIAEELGERQKVFGGDFPESFWQVCAEKRVYCYDYMKEETIALKNAIATAEGALAEAIQLGNENLHGKKSLVIGYGRCGKMIADKLQGMKSEVTILEEQEVRRVQAQTQGLQIMENICDWSPKDYTYLFNTVPSLLLDKAHLEKTEDSVVIIDIASGGGVDYEYCKEKGIKAKLCSGLPGKYAPKASAEILYEYVKKKCK